MSTQEIKNIINQYFDNELTKSEEVLLFTQLSQDEETREYFKQLNLLKTITEDSLVDFPEKLDSKIFSKLKREEFVVKKTWSRSNVFAAISYGFALLLLAISVFFYTESMQYRNKLELTNQRVYQQNQLIQVLYNTIPQTEIRGRFDNEIVASQM